jgi:hypothetical protein
VDWIRLAQDRDRCRGLSNTVVKCWKLTEKANNYYLTKKYSYGVCLPKFRYMAVKYWLPCREVELNFLPSPLSD